MDIVLKIGVFLVLVTGIDVIVAVSKNCDRQEIRKCQDKTGMSAFLELIGQDVTVHYDVIIETTWLFKLKKMNVISYCDIWPHYETCLRGNVIPGCDAAHAALLKGMDRATDLLCQLVEHGDDFGMLCQGNISLVAELVAPCMHNFVNDSTGQLMDKHTICKQSTLDVKGCINRVVRNSCGFDTELWFSKYITRANKPIFDLYKCNVWPTWAVICLNVAIATALLVFILSCTIFCYCKIRRSNQKTLESDVSMIHTSYRQLRQPRMGSGRNERDAITSMDASVADEGTELVSIPDRKVLMSNQIL